MGQARPYVLVDVEAAARPRAMVPLASVYSVSGALLTTTVSLPKGCTLNGSRRSVAHGGQVVQEAAGVLALGVQL